MSLHDLSWRYEKLLEDNTDIAEDLCLLFVADQASLVLIFKFNRDICNLKSNCKKNPQATHLQAKYNLQAAQAKTTNNENESM